jgi:hypothetical protein
MLSFQKSEWLVLRQAKEHAAGCAAGSCSPPGQEIVASPGCFLPALCVLKTELPRKIYAVAKAGVSFLELWWVRKGQTPVDPAGARGPSLPTLAPPEGNPGKSGTVGGSEHRRWGASPVQRNRTVRAPAGFAGTRWIGFVPLCKSKSASCRCGNRRRPYVDGRTGHPDWPEGKCSGYAAVAQDRLAVDSGLGVPHLQDPRRDVDDVHVAHRSVDLGASPNGPRATPPGVRAQSLRGNGCRHYQSFLSKLSVTMFYYYVLQCLPYGWCLRA